MHILSNVLTNIRRQLGSKRKEKHISSIDIEQYKFKLTINPRIPNKYGKDYNKILFSSIIQILNIYGASYSAIRISYVLAAYILVLQSIELLTINCSKTLVGSRQLYGKFASHTSILRFTECAA